MSLNTIITAGQLSYNLECARNSKINDFITTPPTPPPLPPHVVAMVTLSRQTEKLQRLFYGRRVDIGNSRGGGGGENSLLHRLHLSVELYNNEDVRGGWQHACLSELSEFH